LLRQHYNNAYYPAPPDQDTCVKHLLIHALNHTRLVLVSTWHQFYVSSNTRLLAIALIIGLATGLTNWVFRVAIELTQAFVFEGFAHKYAGYLGGFVVVIGLGGAGIIVGWLTSRFVGTERHRGITGIIESVAVGGGRLPYWRMPAKALASILSLGAGASVGTEDPSVQIGANLGAFIAHKLHTTEEQTRLLIASGAASATAAAFNAPIAGVFFALEVVMQKDFSTSEIGRAHV
jgi:chloride channel protein, CIC family